MTTIRLLSPVEWQGAHREPLQKYANYKRALERSLRGVEEANRSLADADKTGAAPLSRVMLAAQLRGSESLEPIIYSYSAGLPVAELAGQLEVSLGYWEAYAEVHLSFHRSAECEGRLVPHLDLGDRDYWEALQLVCFAITFGRQDLLPRVMRLLEYQNAKQDALLEALVEPYLPGRPPADTYTRQLPYRKTRRIFSASPAERPELMIAYLDEWYDASRREPYHDRHNATYFPGYWSLEAAAMTLVLDIDDASYEQKRFYPKDLVAYGRQRLATAARTRGLPAGQPSTLRCPAGDRCPQTGLWVTPAVAGSRRHFQQGDVMPELGGDYGTTIWQWDDNQAP